MAVGTTVVVERDAVAAVPADELLTDGYRDLEQLAIRYRTERDERGAPAARDVAKTLRYASRLIDLSGPRNIAVIGCGHKPEIVMALLAMGHRATGIEPVGAYIAAAAEYLGRSDVVRKGEAEDIPLPDGSQDFVLFENVLEHVTSVRQALGELYRVTRPGGIVLVKTSSRYNLVPASWQSEFRVPFFPWLPSIVKEAYVHQHLHVEPRLANYSPRPAVHWFDYAQLCRLGRDAGFTRFYSLLDVVRESDPSIANHGFRRRVIRLVKYRPWFRALALTQLGGIVYMYKSPALAT